MRTARLRIVPGWCDLWLWLWGGGEVLWPLTLARGEVLRTLTLSGGRYCDLSPCPGGGIVTFDPGLGEVYLWPWPGGVLWPLTLAGGRCYDLWPLLGGGVVTFDPSQTGGGVATFHPGHWDRSHLPSLFSDRMTNTCENITFSRFAMRLVKTQKNLGEGQPIRL